MAYMFVTELTSQLPMDWLKAVATYIAARDGRPCGVSSDLGARGWGTGDEDDTATLEQQHAGWRNTSPEHGVHVRHLAHVPIADGLIEGKGILHRREGRAAVWREQLCRSEGMGDGWRRRHGDARAATRGVEEHVP